MTAAYELLESDLGPIAGRRLLVLGAGSMAGLAARTAAAAGAQVTCVNRTYERALRLAASIDGRARPLAELADALTEADLVVTCTGARDVFLDAAQLAHSPVVGIVDLALPADVSDDVTELGVVLVNLARLVADQPDHASRGEVETARPWSAVRSRTSSVCGGRPRSPPPSSPCAPWRPRWSAPSCPGWTAGRRT